MISMEYISVIQEQLEGADCQSAMIMYWHKETVLTAVQCGIVINSLAQQSDIRCYR